MQEKHERAESGETKFPQLGDHGALPGAASGPPTNTPANASVELELHELVHLFPPMSEAEFADFKADIARRGQLDPIWTYQGKVIDGRNRLRACKELGIVPVTREWDGKGTLLEFVVSRNLHRRHLNETQRAMVAARLKPHYEKMAKERSLAGKELDPTPNLAGGESRSQAGNMLNVSRSSVGYACIVLDRGIPELIALVDRSEIPVSKAAILATLPLSSQRDIIAQGVPHALEIARELEERKRAERRMQERGAEGELPPVTLECGLVEIKRHGRYYRLEVGDDWPEILKSAVTQWVGFDRAIDHGGIIIVKKKGV